MKYFTILCVYVCVCVYTILLDYNDSVVDLICHLASMVEY